MPSSFVHLHQHTEYSMLDGASRIGDVVAAAVRDGQPAMGITDHGNMYGVLDFYQECNAQGIKPIIGSELYMAYEDRTERLQQRGSRVDDSGGAVEGGKKAYYHLTTLVENQAGYRNLIQLSSRAFLEGYYRKPKVDWDLLEQHSEGIIVTTGCLGGHVLQAMMNEGFDAACEKAGRLLDIFGRDHLFVELQDHGIEDQQRTNPLLVRLANRLRLPLLATNDSHYVHQHDAVAHDALLCVQTGSLRSDPDRFRFHGDQHYVKSAVEMRSLFGELPSACDNTLWIAERCELEIEFGKPQLPEFPLPEGFADASAYLEHLTFEGARARWGDHLADDVVERLVYELRVIADMGFSSYFLIVWDLIRHARNTNIRVGPGRGSAAGCAVAYCLRITDLDPIRYDLLFERFLNPSRISMPDIDMDFDSRYRDEMIRYAAERYGRDHVAQIVTFSTIKARAAVRDAARVLGLPYALGDRVAKAMPPLTMGRDTPLHACLEKDDKYADGFARAAELREMYASDPDAKEVIDVARGLEGLRRGDGIHAAAVVITREPLTEYLPVQRKPEAGQDPEDAPVVTQYEMHGVEDLGLLKMDFLGLRNLDVITDTLDLIRQRRGDDVDIDSVPLDDEPTFELLRRAETIGVFQLEGTQMRTLIRSLAPTEFEDVAALVALYRPGPMAANMHTDYADRKNGRQEVSYLHADAEDILGETYGLCLTGETVVVDARTGRPARLDQVDPAAGFWVQGVDEDLRPAVRQVTHWVDNGVRSTVRLTLANGMELTGTPDHPVLCERGWVGLGDLRGDDWVATAPELLEPTVVAPSDRNRLRLLAYLLADGAVSTDSAVVFINRDDRMLDEFEALLGVAFPGDRVSRWIGRDGVTKCTVGNGRGNGGGPSGLLRWLRELGVKAQAGSSPGGPRSHEKWVPDEVFEHGTEDLAWFAAALWDCDGHVGERFAHYRTVSHRLAEGVRMVLLRLGFSVDVYRSQYVTGRGERRVAHQVTVHDGPRFAAMIAPHMVSQSKRDALFAAETRGTSLPRAAVMAQVRSASTTSIRRLAAELDMPRWHFSPNASERHPRIRVSSLDAARERFDLPDVERRANVQWSQVASVVDAGEQRVYDITVDEIHNFVANGIVAHNCIYQEGIMRIAQRFASYSLADADNLRKACGKKDRAKIAAERVKFIDGCETTGYGRQLGEQWFDIIEPFADYAFNKSHSYGYGYVAYQTAYLKANHPAEYLSALLTSVKTNLEKAAVYLAECRAMGIEVLVPDVNRSASDFTPISTVGDDGVEREQILFGLSAVRNVGEALVEMIVEERVANGPFDDFQDFAERVNTQVLNRKTIESLIKAGAFDSMGHPRQGLLAVFQQITDATVARRKEHDMGVMSLFGSSEDGPVFDERVPVPDLEFDKKQRLVFEKEMLGLYVSDHPLLGAEQALAKRTDCGIADLEEATDGDRRTIGGVVTNLSKRWTKRGELMATFTLEDLRSSIEVMVFPKMMAEVGHLLDDDVIVITSGRIDRRDDTPKLIPLEVSVFEPVVDASPPLRLQLNSSRLDDATLGRLRSLFSDFPGESEVLILLDDRDVVRLGDDFLVSTQSGLVGELRALLGHASVTV